MRRCIVRVVQANGTTTIVTTSAVTPEGFWLDGAYMFILDFYYWWLVLDVLATATSRFRRVRWQSGRPFSFDADRCSTSRRRGLSRRPAVRSTKRPYPAHPAMLWAGFLLSSKCDLLFGQLFPFKVCYDCTANLPFSFLLFVVVLFASQWHVNQYVHGLHTSTVPVTFAVLFSALTRLRAVTASFLICGWPPRVVGHEHWPLCGMGTLADSVTIFTSLAGKSAAVDAVVGNDAILLLRPGLLNPSILHLVLAARGTCYLGIDAWSHCGSAKCCRVCGSRPP
jgi:hypothetical protein